MKKTFLPFFFSVFLFFCFSAFSNAQSWFSPEVEARAEEILRNMTLHEKLIYIGGTDWMYSKPIHRLGIPQLKMSDGPQGLGTWGNSTAYPSAQMLAATWNRTLAFDYGAALAADCKARGVNIILGPGVNIYRAPMCGRNFEYMGEDPYLAAQTSQGYIKGVQANGVMAVIKHFAANFQEYDRNNVSSNIDERTLHEIYLPAFRNAVQKAEVGAIMTSYNKLNGVWTTLSPYLLKDILRQQWAFNGLVMSDWGSTHYGLPAATSGLDLEMPSNERQQEDSLRYYLQTGKISIDDINLKVKHTLQTFIAFGFFDRPQLDTSIPLNNPASVQTALDVAEEGIVLLKNENNILPFKAETLQKIAVIGNNALIYAAGGGSGLVFPFSYTTYFDGLQTLAATKGIEVTYVDKYDHFQDIVYAAAGSQTKGFTAQYFNNTSLTGTPVVTKIDSRIGFEWTAGTSITGVNKNDFSVRWTGEIRPTVSGNCEFLVSGDDGFRLFIDNQVVIDDYVPAAFHERRYTKNIVAGQNYSIRLEYFQAGGGAQIDFCWLKPNDENRFTNLLNEADAVVAFIGHNQSDEGEGGDRGFKLPLVAETMIKEAQQSSKPIVAVVNAGGNVYTQDWLNGCKGLLWGWYGGQEAGAAMAKILLGDVSPSGKLPVTFERRWEDNPAYNSYYDNGTKRVNLTEGVFIGYRGYDKLNRQPQYPFGYGLSYTTFQLSDIQTNNLSDNDNLLSVTCKIKNTGAMAGAEVAQLYVGKQGGSAVQRPIRELKNYEKVFLQPNEEKTVTMLLDKDAFSYFSVENHAFVVDNGDYKIEIGASSRDIKLSALVTIAYLAAAPATVSTKQNANLFPSIVRAGEKIEITCENVQNLTVYNANGQKITDSQNLKTIDTKGYAAGIYFVKYAVGNKVFEERFVVK